MICLYVYLLFVVGTKIARSRDVGILVHGQWFTMSLMEKKSDDSLASMHLTSITNATNRIYFNGHTYQPHPRSNAIMILRSLHCTCSNWMGSSSQKYAMLCMLHVGVYMCSRELLPCRDDTGEIQFDNITTRSLTRNLKFLSPNITLVLVPIAIHYQ